MFLHYLKKTIEQRDENKIRCTQCCIKFACLALHHIPDNNGNDCTVFCDRNKCTAQKDKVCTIKEDKNKEMCVFVSGLYQ